MVVKWNPSWEAESCADNEEVTVIYGITVYMSPRLHNILEPVESSQILHRICFKTIVILSFRLCPCLRIDCFLSDFPTKILSSKMKQVKCRHIQRYNQYLVMLQVTSSPLWCNVNHPCPILWRTDSFFNYWLPWVISAELRVLLQWEKCVSLLFNHNSFIINCPNMTCPINQGIRQHYNSRST